jgi:hypothetical protein
LRAPVGVDGAEIEERPGSSACLAAAEVIALFSDGGTRLCAFGGGVDGGVTGTRLCAFGGGVDDGVTGIRKGRGRRELSHALVAADQPGCFLYALPGKRST